jgi:hypothetical protein
MPINYYVPQYNIPQTQVYNQIPQNSGYMQAPVPSKIETAQKRLYFITNPLNIQNEYKDNPEYKKLRKSEYFNTPNGEFNLINIITNLEYSKNNAVINNYYYPKVFFDGGMSKKTEEADIEKCLKNINTVLENEKISPNIKNYAVANAGNLRFQITALDPVEKIDKNDINKIENAITNPLAYLYY